MKTHQSAFTLALTVLLSAFSCSSVRAADVAGYSVLKGQFLYQVDETTLLLDEDLGISILASVDLTDYDLATGASLTLPDGEEVAMDNASLSWDYLDYGYSTFSTLNADYGWGQYTVDFVTVNDGEFSCPISFPSTPLPPQPRLLNFREVQAVDASQPLTLRWDYSTPPASNDFIQVYIDMGHGDAFSTPGYGEEGALDINARSLIVPAGSMLPGYVYNVNLEITRIVFTNTTSYPSAPGLAGTFSSTAIPLVTITPPAFQIPAAPTNGVFWVQVNAELNTTLVLQASLDLASWSDVATNTVSTNLVSFAVPVQGQPFRFFRALQR
jgi:hypothetical protein